MAGGRPTKDEVMVARLAFVDEIDKALKNVYVRLDDRYEIGEDPNFLTKFDDLDVAVKEAYEKAVVEHSATGFNEAMSVPWMTSTDPVTYGRQLMHQLWICQRIIEVLERHLVNQVLVQNSIQRRLTVVKNTVVESTERLPKTLSEFIRGLHQNGLRATSVKGFTPGDLEALANALNNRDLSAIDGIFRPGRKPLTDDELDKLIHSAQQMAAKRAAASPPNLEPALGTSDVPPPPIHDEEWLDVCTAAPPEFFDGIDEVGVPYRWHYRDARMDETKSVLDLPLPPQDSWERLKQYDSNIRQQLELRKFGLKVVEDLLSGYIGFLGGIPFHDVPLNWIKAWILLLIARPTPALLPELLGDQIDSYFDGVALPVTSHGSGRVRELVRNS